VGRGAGLRRLRGLSIRLLPCCGRQQPLGTFAELDRCFVRMHEQDWVCNWLLFILV
jgi:hypothetical protein